MYWGDVGPDSVQNVTTNRAIWERVALLVEKQLLQTIIIEVSYPNSQPDTQLYGHLTPKYLIQELHVLASFLNNQSVLTSFTVFVNHIKPSLNQGQTVQSTINEELRSLNDLGIKFVFPQQGFRYDV